MGRLTARKAEGRAGAGGRKKRRPGGNRRDRGLCPAPKGGPRPADAQSQILLDPLKRKVDVDDGNSANVAQSLLVPLGCHRLAPGRKGGKRTPEAHCEGDARGRLEQGERPATSSDTLDFRPSFGGKAGDRKPRKGNAGCGSSDLVHPGVEDSGPADSEEGGVSSPTAPKGFHSEKQRDDAAARDPDHERSSHAGTASAGAGPGKETRADGHSYGFRPGRSTADARAQLFNALSKRTSPPFILEGDIEACFDRISHEWLLSHVPMDKTLLHEWLKAGVIHKGELQPTKSGTPQGGIVSPVLANWALDGLESLTLKGSGGKGLYFVRFADDWVVTGSSPERLEEVKEHIQEFLAERGMTLSPTKTRIAHIDEGFDFLGWNFRKYHGKLLIKPSEKNVKMLLTKVRDWVDRHKQARQIDVIGFLNPLIRGWANYHRGAVAKETFAHVDAKIFELLWQWAKRRHPGKRARWIRERYFHTIGTRIWVFADRDSKGNWLSLVKASDTKIVRHVKLRKEANPYDPTWEKYFKDRRRRKLETTGEERWGMAEL